MNEFSCLCSLHSTHNVVGLQVTHLSLQSWKLSSIMSQNFRSDRAGLLQETIAYLVDQKRSRSFDVTPSSLVTSKISKSHSVTNVLHPSATNGPLPAAPSRPSPAPQNSQGPPVPNGKPTAPYVERNNSMSPNGQIAAQTVSSKDPKVAAQAASDMKNVVRRKLTGYVGFANLPNQWHRKSVRKGFNFNVMVVGKTPWQAYTTNFLT